MDCNLCTPFKHDIRCASLCGVEFVVTKEKRAQRESCLKGVLRLLKQSEFWVLQMFLQTVNSRDNRMGVRNVHFHRYLGE